MLIRPDVIRLREALNLLRLCSPDTRLLHLKNLCIDNGVWTVPEDPARYAPVIFEVLLFGVPAIAETADALPMNWMRAAENTLRSCESDRAA